MKKLMVAALIVVVVIGAFAQPMKMKKGVPEKMIEERCLCEELQLTDEQVTKLDEIQKKYQKEVIKLRAELKLANLELKELVEKEASQKDIQKALDKVNNLRAKMLSLRVNKRLEIGKVLTDKQKKLLKEKPAHYFLRGYGFPRGMREGSKQMMGMVKQRGCFGKPGFGRIEKEIRILRDVD
ncbi:MAG: Spy/CpxP family protein refolding chaperone [Candidatus Marinimicrobia bacterium]|nr:Spy/CpxP family protein refolding chaperone [Candidatus Neomarinimicrobiota bacterium]